MFSSAAVDPEPPPPPAYGPTATKIRLDRVRAPRSSIDHRRFPHAAFVHPSNQPSFHQGGSVLLSLCELTPWERWRHYGVRPYKLVLHLLLLLCTTASILHESRRCVLPSARPRIDRSSAHTHFTRTIP